MQPAETAKVCALLAAAFPAWTVKEDTISVWHMSLKDLSGEIVLRAAELWVLTEEKFPTIAGIRRLSAEVAGVLAPSGTDAWAEVMACISEMGRRPEHPAVAKAAQLIGWWELRHSENITATRSQFLKAYGDISTAWNKSVVNQIGFTSGEPMVSLTGQTQGSLTA